MFIGVVLNNILNDFRIDEVSLRWEAFYEESDKISWLTWASFQFNTFVQIILSIDFVISVIDCKFAGVKRMQGHSRIVYRVLKWNNVLLRRLLLRLSVRTIGELIPDTWFLLLRFVIKANFDEMLVDVHFTLNWGVFFFIINNSLILCFWSFCLEKNWDGKLTTACA